MPLGREEPKDSNAGGTSKVLSGRGQILLHLPNDLCRRLRSKAKREKRTVSAQTELYIEVMLGLTPADEFAIIQGYRASAGG